MGPGANSSTNVSSNEETQRPTEAKHIEQRSLPLTVTSEYRQTDGGEVISKLAGFESQEISGLKFSLEFHKLEESGETHVVLRKVK